MPDTATVTTVRLVPTENGGWTRWSCRINPLGHLWEGAPPAGGGGENFAELPEIFRVKTRLSPSGPAGPPPSQREAKTTLTISLQIAHKSNKKHLPNRRRCDKISLGCKRLVRYKSCRPAICVDAGGCHPAIAAMGYFRGVCPILEPGEKITDSDGIRSLGREVTPLRNGRNQCSDLIC